MAKQYYVYILASDVYKTLYIGVTSNIIRRMWEHRQNSKDGFTRKYDVKKLMWFEIHTDIVAAITREKQLKKWNRAWKIALIQKDNPSWRDLSEDFTA